MYSRIGGFGSRDDWDKPYQNRYSHKQLFHSHSLVISAIDHDGLPGDGSCTIRREPQDGVGDLFRFGKAADRNIGRPFLIDLLLTNPCGKRAHTGELLQSLSGGVTGSNVVYGNPVF